MGGENKKGGKSKKGGVICAGIALVVAAGLMTARLATNESSLTNLSSENGISVSGTGGINADISVVDADYNEKEIITEDVNTEDINKEDINKEEVNKEDAEPEDTGKENIKEDTQTETAQTKTAKEYRFRSKKNLASHFEKHGGEFDGLYKTAEEYEAGAARVINDPSALHKLEAEDGDDVYYKEATNEFVILSKDGYIRTYFKPSAGKKYYDRQ